MSFLGPLISGVSSLVGGLLSSNAAKSAAQEQADLQKEFAQNAIQWKVADAKKAGIHPLYAMGANTVSYSPVSVGDTSLGPALSDMGQDVSRAVEAVASADERAVSKQLAALQLERAGLENQFLKTQIAGQVNANVRSAQVGPAMPLDRVQAPQRTPGMWFMGKWIPFDEGTSDLGQIGEDRAGEHLGTIYGVPAVVADIKRNLGSMSVWDLLRGIDNVTRMPIPSFPASTYYRRERPSRGSYSSRSGYYK